MRLRGPATVVVLVALGLHLVVVLVSAASSPGDPGLVAPNLTYALVDPVLLLLLTALVIACWVAPPAAHARGLTVAALALTLVTLVGVAVFGVLTAVRAPPGRLVGVPVPGGVAPGRRGRRARRPDRPAAPAGGRSRSAPRAGARRA